MWSSARVAISGHWQPARRFGRIIINEGANIQDTCVLHGFYESDTIVDVDGHIGHGAVLHGCRIERDALVGMNAIIMDDAVVGESSIVGAAAFVKAGMIIPARSLVMGTPAKIVRDLREEEILWKRQGTVQYHELSVRSATTMRAVSPLTEVEFDRKRLQCSAAPNQRTARPDRWHHPRNRVCKRMLRITLHFQFIDSNGRGFACIHRILHRDPLSLVKAISAQQIGPT